MVIELLTFRGFRSPLLTVARPRKAFPAREAPTTRVTCRTVDNPEGAERLGFRVSPTILACRLYPDIRDRSPAFRQIQAVPADAG